MGLSRETPAGPIPFSLHVPFHSDAQRNCAYMGQRRDLIQQCHDYAKHPLTWIGTVQKQRLQESVLTKGKIYYLKPMLIFILRKQAFSLYV